MMGGDYAPTEAVNGLKKYLTHFKKEGTTIQLLGQIPAIEAALAAATVSDDMLEIVDCPDVIGYHEHPVKALKSKPQSSIAIGFGMLAAGNTDAFISAGNTGAMMVGSMFSLKLSEGVLRPTIGTIIPREGGKTGLLVDVGINSDCKPENLEQFAVMGSAYARHILDIEKPTVGLLNIGEEEGKGNLLAQAAYPLLKSNKHISFHGNVEGRDILDDIVDVIVCDGFTGNVLLKLLESIYPITRRQGINHPYLDRFHFEQYGGTPILGIEKPVIIGHGVSQEESFCNMILLAEKMVNTSFISKLAAEI